MQDVLYTLMNEFGRKGYIFRDEDDFQLQLFNRMQELYGNVRIEREYPTLISGERAEIDIILQTPEGILPIELKYKLKQGHTPIANARYSFFKDVWRVEQLLFSHKEFGPVGYAIFLTNDPGFWVTPRRESVANYREFIMHEGCEISGTRTWWADKKKEKPHSNPMWSRPLSFQGSYPIAWRDYSNNIKGDSSQSGVFRYTVVEVKQSS
jgi:hypothetical protein